MKKDRKIVSKNLALAKYHEVALYSRQYNVWWMGSRLYKTANLDYDTNMENSMSLVNQIESLGYCVEIRKNRCSISRDTQEGQYIIDVTETSKAESIFEACYQFITEYDTNCIMCDSKNIFRFEDMKQVENNITKTILSYCKDCNNSWEDEKQ